MNIQQLKLPVTATIRQAMSAIDQLGTRILFLVDDRDLLRGVVTDGNIRRGLLSGHSLDDPVATVMNSQPVKVTPDTPKAIVRRMMRERDIFCIPVVNDAGRLIGVFSQKTLEGLELQENPVVIMSGGLGTRLGELTRNCPKPMLCVGDKPILQIIVEKLAGDGFNNIFISVNYKAEMVKDFFRDGEAFGVKITYIHEKKRLGTAGALSLIDPPASPCLVMNGDILTSISPRQLLEVHKTNNVPLTMAVREFEIQVPYGIVTRTDDNMVSQITEKPIYKFCISAGINVLSSEAFNLIPKNKFFDMPDLFKLLIDAGTPPACYPIDEYWLDIGRMDDYKKAQIDLKNMPQLLFG